MPDKSENSFNSNIRKKYIDRILSSKNTLISELTDEFGNEYEGLLNERFDKIKFVFFTSLRSFKRYLRNKYSYLVASKTVEFIKENGILDDIRVSDHFKHICGYIVESDEEDLFYSIFDNYSLEFNFEEKTENVFGIYSFDTSLDYNILNTYAQNRNISVLEFVRNNRCDFLRNIGRYPKDYSNEMILKDINYSNLCNYYEELMKKYNAILNDIQVSMQGEINMFNKLKSIRKTLFVNGFKSMLEGLNEYLSDSDKKKVASDSFDLNEIDFLNVFFYKGQSLNDKCKLESLPEEEVQKLYSLYYGENGQKIDIAEIVKNAREKAAKSYNKQILQTFTFESNCDISSLEINVDLSSFDSTLSAIFEQENGKEKNRLLLFDPLICEEEYLDIHLRHEIRHSLTTSIQRKNDLDVVKCGNVEYVYSDGDLISVNNEFYNELVTQKKALENTKTSFEKGIYILSPKDVSFTDEITSAYDEYLTEFDRVYAMIPQDVMRSQIEEDNENLYSFISQDEINKIEDSLKHHDNIPEDILSSILNRDKMSK